MQAINILMYSLVDDGESDSDLDVSGSNVTPPLQEDDLGTRFGRMYNLCPNPRKSARLICR